MTSRLSDMAITQPAMKAVYGLETYLATSSVEQSLLHLIKMRVSQMNGCAYCIDMHSKDLRAAGESEQRIYLLDAWREAPFYSARERAALEWAEALTFVAEEHVPDELYERVRAELSELELVDLTVAVAAIKYMESNKHRLPHRGRLLQTPGAPRVIPTARPSGIAQRIGAGSRHGESLGGSPLAWRAGTSDLAGSYQTEVRCRASVLSSDASGSIRPLRGRYRGARAAPVSRRRAQRST